MKKTVRIVRTEDRRKLGEDITKALREEQIEDIVITAMTFDPDGYLIAAVATTYSEQPRQR